MNPETTLMRAIREAINRDGRARLVRYHAGFDVVNKVKYGMVGWPDLIGVLRNGRCFCVEVKTPTGRLSREQVAFWAAARKWNVAGGVATSVAEALALLEAACAGT
jgi:hypothetical protein